MRLSLRLLETMEQDRKTKFWTEEEQRQQRNKTIATLRRTQVELEDQLGIILGKLEAIKAAPVSVRRFRKKPTKKTSVI